MRVLVSQQFTLLFKLQKNGVQKFQLKVGLLCKLRLHQNERNLKPASTGRLRLCPMNSDAVLHSCKKLAFALFFFFPFLCLSLQG